MKKINKVIFAILTLSILAFSTPSQSEVRLAYSPDIQGVTLSLPTGKMFSPYFSVMKHTYIEKEFPAFGVELNANWNKYFSFKAGAGIASIRFNDKDTSTNGFTGGIGLYNNIDDNTSIGVSYNYYTDDIQATMFTIGISF